MSPEACTIGNASAISGKGHEEQSAGLQKTALVRYSAHCGTIWGSRLQVLIATGVHPVRYHAAARLTREL